MGDTPQYNQPAPDPALAILQQQAQQANLTALQQSAQVDTAKLMTLYGTQAALAGKFGGSPLIAPPMPAAPGARA